MSEEGGAGGAAPPSDAAGRGKQILTSFGTLLQKAGASKPGLGSNLAGEAGQGAGTSGARVGAKPCPWAC